METPIAAIARWLVTRKHSYSCDYCLQPLDGGGTCSDECAERWNELTAI
jgi:hypothetical protein